MSSSNERLRETVLALATSRATRVPAYRRILEACGLTPSELTSFDQLPVITKDQFFAGNTLDQVCVDGKLEDAALVYTSSGFSDTFSFGVETAEQLSLGHEITNQLLELHCHVSSRKTLLVNALPMGVRVPGTNVLCFDAGMRVDSTLAVIKATASKGTVQQLILLGEHLFLKHLIEVGIENGIEWRRIPTFLFTGGEIIPESYRSYIGSLLGHNDSFPEKGFTTISLGISEVGLSLGREDGAVVGLRRLLSANPSLRTRLFDECPFVPTLVNLSPGYYVETPIIDGKHRFVVTPLDSTRLIPLIRYNTGDHAMLLDPTHIQAALHAVGITQIPQFTSPVLAFFGRAKSVQGADSSVYYPESIKECLYALGESTKSVTGNFRLSNDESGLRVRLQLKPDRSLDSDSIIKIKAALEVSLQTSLTLEPVPFHALGSVEEHWYGRKFRYCE